MKPIQNYHVHSTVSDGKISPEEVVKQSIDFGVKYLSITDHYPLPNDRIEKWSIKYRNEDFREFVRLKEKYKEKISIAIGIEMDWFERYQNYTKREIQRRPYDFVIGSIHFLPLLKGQDYRNINNLNTIDDLTKDHGSIERVVKEYYRQTRLMTQSGLFDCIGHIDRIKFPYPQAITLPVYSDEILKTLNVAQKTDTCVEINTSGYLHKNVDDAYPNEWIVQEMAKRNIPITIGTDGHREINHSLTKGHELARRVGYTELQIFNRRKRKGIIF